MPHIPIPLLRARKQIKAPVSPDHRDPGKGELHPDTNTDDDDTAVRLPNPRKWAGTAFQCGRLSKRMAVIYTQQEGIEFPSTDMNSCSGGMGGQAELFAVCECVCVFCNVVTKFTHSKAGGSGQLYGLLSAIAVSAGLQYSYIFTATVLNVLLRCLVWLDSKCRFFYTLSLPIEPIVIVTMGDTGGNSDFFHPYLYYNITLKLYLFSKTTGKL